MKKIWGLGAMVLSCGLGLTQFACSGSTEQVASHEGDDHKMADLIGSVAVNSKSLDGIGSIGFVYDYGSAGAGGASSAGASAQGSAPGSVPVASGGSPFVIEATAGSGGGGWASPFSAQCTGTLVSKNSVLTSRSCGALFQQVYEFSKLKFAIGPDSTQPKRLIDVVDVEFAPAVVAQDGSLSNPDIAVLHLGESVTDVAVFPVALLSDDLIGKPLAAVGFGNSDLRYQSGARRAGALTLRATGGLVYPLIFNTFDAFYAYSLGGGGYPPYYYGSGGVSASLPFPGAGAAGAATAGAGGMFGEVGGSGGAFAGSSGGGGDDWYRQYLRQQYDTTLLGSGESYLGGTDDDAQPCGADQGGPVVRKLQGQVRVLGVFSRTPFGACEKGGIYASITAATKPFIDSAAQWKDPCTGLTGNGKCAGTTATRCSSFAEGKRRAVKFDCALLNQVCVGGGSTEVACSDK